MVPSDGGVDVKQANTAIEIAKFNPVLRIESARVRWFALILGIIARLNNGMNKVSKRVY